MSLPTRREFAVAAVGANALAATLGASALAAEKVRPAGPGSAPPFQLGTVTYNIAAKWDLATLLTVCKKTGIAAVEARTTHKHGIEPSLSDDDRRDIKKQFADAGVVFWGSGSTCEFHATDPAVVAKQIETCKEFIKLVADLGGRGVKVRPNALPKGVPVEKTLEQIGKSLIPCGQAAADAGVEIWVEVHGPGTQNPPHMKTIMEQCGHPAVGICWNSNATDLVNGSVAESFAMLKPWLKSCHINDLANDAAGRYPYRELFSLLRAANYNRYTMIELGYTPPDVGSGEQILRLYKALWLELTRV